MAKHHPIPHGLSLQDLEQFWRRIKILGIDNCWLWTVDGRRPKRYAGFHIAAEGRNIPAHRLMYKLHYHKDPGDMLVMHTCDNPGCVNPWHLTLGTTLDNRRDCVAKGRTAKGDRNGARLYPERLVRGERNPSCKLTDAKVDIIRRMYLPRVVPFAKIGLLFGVSKQCIRAIVTGKSRVRPTGV